MKINVIPHKEEWEREFNLEKARLQDFLADPNLVIEHIGSTAVRGLAAEPVIDIMIGTPDLKTLDTLSEKFLRSQGYVYVQKREEDFPTQRYFAKFTFPDSSRYSELPAILQEDETLPDELHDFRSHQIYALVKDSQFWDDHLLFRRLLQKNPIVREQYGEFKMELAQLRWDRFEDYSHAKADFIQGCLVGMRRP